MSGATRRTWQPHEVMLLRQHFADTRTQDLADALGRAYSAVARKAAELGLRKSEQYLASPDAGRTTGQHGRSTRFQPGGLPWNKGKAFNPGGRSAQTRFQRGQLNGRAAQLAVPVGTYRVNGDGYLDQKISDQPGPTYLRWRAVHRLVWEAAHGPVPAGYAVCFLPGRRTTDPDRITPDALELVTRRELMLRNTFHRYGPDVARVVQLRGALTRAIRRQAATQSVSDEKATT